MFKNKDASAEIAASMESHLVSHVIEKRAEGMSKFARALDHLNSVAEIFDELGLTKEAEITTTFLVAVAKKAKKKPSKSKSKSKSSKPRPKAKSKKRSTEGLTSEKMVENLKHKGWVFDADDGFADDAHHDSCMCSDCMDADDSFSEDGNFGNDGFPYEKEENEQDFARKFHDLLNEDEDSEEDDESSPWDRETLPSTPIAKRHRSIDDFDF